MKKNGENLIIKAICHIWKVLQKIIKQLIPAKQERFTKRARRVLSLAEEGAKCLHHNVIEPEHVLLGLIREDGGIAARVLQRLNLNEKQLAELVEQVHPANKSIDQIQITLSDDLKDLLYLAVTEARRLGHNYVGTEHLLLGLILQPHSMAVNVLQRTDVNLDDVRHNVYQVIREFPLYPTA